MRGQFSRRAHTHEIGPARDKVNTGFANNNNNDNNGLKYYYITDIPRKYGQDSVFTRSKKKG